ncbi:MAG: GIY-YIG nuclease family protein [Chitinophagaceae bacterium]|nr:GIY-YIG nuclease family protein [Chitinophagaceae bacterium]
MYYVVYILWSVSVQKFYIGQTQDLENRLMEHNAGEGRFTRLGRPWVLVYQQACVSRTEAMLLEKKIKARGAKRFLSDNDILF